MKEGGGEEPVKLIGPFRMQKRYHSADVMQTLHLWAQGRFLMKVAVNKVAVFLRGDSTHPMNPDTTWMTYHFTDHVFRHFIFVATDGEVAVAPLIPVFAVKEFLRFTQLTELFRPIKNSRTWVERMRILRFIEH